MRKRLWMLIPAISLMLAGCSGENTKDLPKAVSDFYESSYTYRKTTTKADELLGEDGVYKLVKEGKITNSPYKEYYKIVESTDTVMLDEVYCYGDGEVVNAVLGWNGEQVKQTQKREHPYGYGEKLKLQYDREETLDGTAVKVYTSEYEVKLQGGYEDSETKAKEVKAIVEQEYYIDEEKQELRRIVTDLTDLNEKQAELNAEITGSNPIAAKMGESSKEHEEVEVLDILEINEDIDIEIPEV